METSDSPIANPSAETPTQKQARLRRERREAKLKVEGSSRLERITKVSGRQNLPDPPPSISQISSDPEEVDISSHPSATPNVGPQQQSESRHVDSIEADLRAAMRARAPQQGAKAEGGTSGEDPMTRLISQLMGGMAGGENGGADGSDGGLPPGLAAMLGAGGPAGASNGLPEHEQDSFGYLWKIIHAVCALSLGLFVAATSTISGQGIQRESLASGLQGPTLVERPNIFFIFATVELILQSSRFLLEKGNGRGKIGGWVGLVAGLLPEPYRGYVVLVGRYAKIWGIVVEDAMVVVFVIGCMAWWNPVVR